eukprot:c16335_g1_i2.p1 GENE.c16335_g1_i2~~c16335_g1_i2.p1  ORF type:complete len:331 (+),score=46.05 c16335_g1_i2:28-1020(+)
MVPVFVGVSSVWFAGIFGPRATELCESYSFEYVCTLPTSGAIVIFLLGELLLLKIFQTYQDPPAPPKFVGVGDLAEQLVPEQGVPQHHEAEVTQPEPPRSVHRRTILSSEEIRQRRSQILNTPEPPSRPERPPAAPVANHDVVPEPVVSRRRVVPAAPPLVPSPDLHHPIYPALATYRGNGARWIVSASPLLIGIARNILDLPESRKVRRLSTRSEAFRSVFRVPGVLRILAAWGFSHTHGEKNMVLKGPVSEGEPQTTVDDQLEQQEEEQVDKSKVSPLPSSTQSLLRWSELVLYELYTSALEASQGTLGFVPPPVTVPNGWECWSQRA